MEPTSFDEIREGCCDIDQRVRDMNANGVLGSMCFPSFPQFCGQLFARSKDKDAAWPSRRTTTGTSTSGAARTRAASSRSRCRRSGTRSSWPTRSAASPQGLPRGHVLGEPGKLGLPDFHSDHWDPFWSACATRARSSACTSARRRRCVDHRRRRADRRPDHPAAGQHRAGRSRPPVVTGAAQVPRPASALRRAASAGSRTSSSGSTTSTAHHRVDRPGLRRQAPERGVPRAHRHVLHRRPCRASSSATASAST